MTVLETVGPLPFGGGPAPHVPYPAVHAAADAAEAMDLPLTMRQLTTLLAAAAPHMTATLPPRPSAVRARDTQRLLQSLIAAGWTVTAMAGRMGMLPSEISSLMRRQECTPMMAARIERAFIELYGMDPLVHGVQQKGATRAANQAARMGWEVIPPGEVAAMRAFHAYD